MVEALWGVEEWGEGPWGGGSFSIGMMSMSAAYAVGEQVLHVELTAEPLHLSTIQVGDALNPQTWAVINTDTSEDLIVVGTTMVDATTVEIYTLKKFQSQLVTHLVSAPGLLDSSESLIASPSSMTFGGCVAASVLSAPAALSDITNVISYGSPAGIIEVGSAGDYTRQSGTPMLQKLIVRRLITAPGEFFYLSGYGLGINEKELLLTSDVAKLQAAAQLQLQNEPELSNAKVQVVLTNDNRLYIKVTGIIAQTQQQVQITIPVTAGGAV